MKRRKRSVKVDTAKAQATVEDVVATLNKIDGRVVTVPNPAARISRMLDAVASPDERPSFAFPRLQRDLALMGAGLIAVAAVFGAAIGVAIDVAIHRHRTA